MRNPALSCPVKTRRVDKHMNKYNFNAYDAAERAGIRNPAIVEKDFWGSFDNYEL